MKTIHFPKIFLILCFILCACVMQAQNFEYVREYIGNIEHKNAVMNGNGEIFIVGMRAGNPSVVKMDTSGVVFWHKTFHEEPVRQISNNRWHFTAVREDDEGNIYLFTEEIANIRTPPPRVVKLDRNGNLIWATAELPVSHEFPYESNQCAWLLAGDTALTISYMDVTSRIHLSTGEVLGKDSILSEFWIENCLNDIVYHGKQYRRSGTGFLAFDESGDYTLEPIPSDLPYLVRSIDSTGYYSLVRSSLNSAPFWARLPRLRHIDKAGNQTQNKLILKEPYFNTQDSLDSRISVNGSLFHPTKGIILMGTYAQQYDEETRRWGVYGNMIFQLRLSDFKILYDSNLTQGFPISPARLMYVDDDIYMLGGHYGREKGVFLMKLNLKNVDDYPASSVPEKQGATNSIKIYPNPSSTGEFVIQSKEESISQIDVFTMTGQIVYSQKVNALQETLQMDTKGIYLVRITTRDNKIETLKIVNQ